MGRFSYH